MTVADGRACVCAGTGLAAGRGQASERRLMGMMHWAIGAPILSPESPLHQPVPAAVPGHLAGSPTAHLRRLHQIENASSW
jgi:hypothetical protein